MHRTPIRRLLLALSVLAIVAAACGDDDLEQATDDGVTTEQDDGATESAAGSDTDAAAEASDFPVTIESAAGTWTLDAAPQRIVSLSPAATEILFAIGAGDQVIAVDNFSYFPEEAPVTDLSGFEPNVEAIVAFDPDLVVITFDPNDLVASLTALDIPVLLDAAPADVESGYASMAQLGMATGRVDEAAAAIADLREEIAAAYAAAPETSVRVYHELGEELFSASSFGFVGSIYAEMGASNIADEADPDRTGFPQLTEEYVVTADPELIVITDLGGYTPEDVAARPGWQEVTAVQNGNIIVVNADIASRWGPRLPEFIAAVADAVASMPVAS